MRSGPGGLGGAVALPAVRSTADGIFQPMKPTILTLDEVAEILRIPPGSHRSHRVHSAMRKIGVTTIRLSRNEWRVSRQDLEAALGIEQGAGRREVSKHRKSE